MLVNQDLEPILKKEVTKNLTKLKASLNQELAMGIEHIKELSRTALEQKIQLQKKLVGFRNDEKRYSLASSTLQIIKICKKPTR